MYFDLDHDMNSSREIETGDFAHRGRAVRPDVPIRVVDWNIDRGLKLAGIIDFLASANADLILLQEADLNAKRTHQLDIARVISQKLQMNYVFGREFQELAQGSERSPAFHGQATLSPWPLSNSRILRFRRQSHFWQPRWFLPNVEPFQERIGGRIARVSEVVIGGRKLLTYNLHLESRGDDGLRRSQLDECLRDISRYRWDTPIVLAGDFNLNASQSGVTHKLAQARFSSTVTKEPSQTTPSQFIFEQGKTIDWIFTRGIARASNLQVHSSVSASDHFPLSVCVAFP
jgi:endonuclease/exonuclease/phosphatase family metal-dependent hydrolase